MSLYENEILPCQKCKRWPERRECCNLVDLSKPIIYFYTLSCNWCKIGIVNHHSRKRANAAWNFLQLKLMSHYSDSELRRFIVDLDESDANISEWEQEFIKSIINDKVFRFSEKQREVIMNMITKYDNKIL